MKEGARPTPREVLERALTSRRMRPLIQQKRLEWDFSTLKRVPVILPPFDKETYSLPRLPENWPSFATFDTGNEIKQIDFLGLSTRAKNALARAGKTNLVKLICSSKDDLLAIRRIGDQKAEEIKSRLELLRLMLKEKQEEKPENLLLLIFADEGISIQHGPPLDSIDLPEPIEIPVEEVIFEEIVEEEVVPAVPAYQFELPEGEEDLTEFDCLIRLGLLKNVRVINSLKRAGITNISQLRQTVSAEVSVRNFGVKGRREVGKALELLDQLVARLQEETPGEESVIIKVPPGEKQSQADIDKAWLRKHAEIIGFIARWQLHHPGKLGAQKAATEKFGATHQRISKIVNTFREITGKPDASKLWLPVKEVVHFIKDWQKDNPGIKGGPSAAARELCISYYKVRRCIRTHEEKTGESLKPQELTLKERREAKEKVLKSKSIEEAMAFLTHRGRGIGQKYPGVYKRFSRIARSAGISNPRELPRVWVAIENSRKTTGFIIKAFPHKTSKGTSFYRFVHYQQEEAMVTWLEQNYSPTPSRVQS